MTTLRLDVDDPGLDSTGLLVRAVAAVAEATVLVDGLDEPVGGLLIHIDGTWLTLDDRATNRAHTIPLARVISITVDYEITDRVAHRQTAVEADTAFLNAVEQHAVEIGTTGQRSDLVRAIALRLRQAGEHTAHGSSDVDHALAVLTDQGRLPDVRERNG